MTTDSEKIALCYFLGTHYLQFTTPMVRDGRAIETIAGVFAGKMPEFLVTMPKKRKRVKP